MPLRFRGLLAFPQQLLTSQLDSDTPGKHVSERLRAALPEVRVQADRPALRWPIGREILHFLLSLRVGTGTLVFGLGDSANAASGTMKL